MGKNWVIQSIRYDLKPTPENYINFKWHHFKFCKKSDPLITAGLYLENLLAEINNEISKQKSVNKKTLTLAIFKKILDNPQKRDELTALFERSDLHVSEAKKFLREINMTVPTNAKNKEMILPVKTLSARTFIIATHLYLELHDNESHYETLVRDTAALKSFIASTFRQSNLSSRIANMKNFSYKKILNGKNNENARGQLKPQFKDIIANPFIFGESVSEYARKIYKEYFEK